MISFYSCQFGHFGDATNHSSNSALALLGVGGREGVHRLHRG